MESWEAFVFIRELSHGARLFKIDVALVHENQDAEQSHVKTERTFLPVPDLRLPHGEPLPADHHEAEDPDQEAQRAARDDEAFRRIERRAAGMPRTPERDGAAQQQHEGGALRRAEMSVAQ